MKLRYLGHSCFQWITDNGVTVLTDPYTKVGYEMPQNLCAELVMCSHEHFDHYYLPGVDGVACVNKAAGDAEYKEIRMQGIQTSHDDKNGALRGQNIVFKFWIDGICFCHLGDLGEPLTQALAEKIGAVDVLLIPIGGTYTIDARQAKAYIERIAPKLVIPMHFRPKDGGLDIAEPSAFLQFFDKERIVKAFGEVELTTETMSALSGKILYMDRVEKL